MLSLRTGITRAVRYQAVSRVNATGNAAFTTYSLQRLGDLDGELTRIEHPDMSGYKFPSSAYDMKLENLETNPAPGVPFCTLKRWIIGPIFLIVIASIIPPVVHRRYWKEHGHRYTEGWGVYHYSTIFPPRNN
eukprot:GHVN01052526.1.p1 GENE.GHVN01052526.1~~GHVN01052526.1.p1  ORF type:complete len:133 (+),score=10.62 GHVN01052526.1:72-470(+)